ncbi:MAG: AAA family ATPase, partial [Planctomycetota bacterium]
MRLSKLTVNGFKSFADKTAFPFDAPITGVVGPNGCGKSNIVDAVKWVLGERSAKSLRGKEMADVIFAGSAGRSPSGMASVTLTFDNPLLSSAQVERMQKEASDGLTEADTEPDEAAGELGLVRGSDRTRFLPIDTETVDIERRLYRDGTSQYLINGRRARLRDIRDLFLDTGVGAHAYSIIEQGKVDAMLLSNPVERRIFFEEAAGVSRFKARRIEAQRKLERAENNLVRAREKLESTERRLRLVRGQATKARKFKDLDVRHRALRLALAFEQYHQLDERLNGLTSRIQSLEADRTAAMAEVESLETDKQTAELERHELTEERQACERRCTGAEHRAQTARQRSEMAERALSDGSHQIDLEQQRLASLEERATSLEEDAQRQNDEAERLTQSVAAAERTLQEAAASRERVQADLATLRHDHSEKRAAVASIDRERIALEARSDADEQRVRTMRERAEQLRTKVAEAERAGTDTRSRIETLEGEITTRSERIEGLEAELSEMMTSASSLSDEQRTVTERLNDLEQQEARLDSRRATLEEMIESRVGLSDAARMSLERGDADRAAGRTSVFTKIESPLADLIDVEAPDAPPVEAALGQNLQGLVIDSLSTVCDSKELEELKGRVVFVPRQTPSSTSPTLHITIPGATPLADLVRCAPQDRALVTRLLGATYLVPSLESAMMLAGGPLSSQPVRFVTRSGEVIESDGRIVAGPLGATDEGAGLLQRSGELHALEKRIAEVHVRIEAERTSVQSLGDRARELNDALSARRVALATEQRALVGEEAARDRLLADRDRIARELSTSTEESQQVTERIASTEVERRDVTDRIEKLRRLHDEQAGVAADLEREIDRASQSLDRTNDRLTSARVETSQLGEQAAAAQRELRRLTQAREDAEREREHLASHLQQQEAKLAHHRQTIDEANQEAEEAAHEAATARESLVGLDGKVEEAAARTQELGERLLQSRQRSSLIERDWSSLEMSKRELEVRREGLEERANTELSLDLTWEFPEYRAM